VALLILFVDCHGVLIRSNETRLLSVLLEVVHRFFTAQFFP